MTQVTKNVPPPVEQPPATIDITGLTVEEYATLWEAMHGIVFNDFSAYRASGPHWVGKKHEIAKKILNNFVGGPSITEHYDS